MLLLIKLCISLFHIAGPTFSVQILVTTTTLGPIEKKNLRPKVYSHHLTHLMPLSIVFWCFQIINFQSIHFMSLVSFYTPENVRKPLFLTFLGDIERNQWYEMCQRPLWHFWGYFKVSYELLEVKKMKELFVINHSSFLFYLFFRKILWPTPLLKGYLRYKTIFCNKVALEV